jgi:hypothetical protein
MAREFQESVQTMEEILVDNNDSVMTLVITMDMTQVVQCYPINTALSLSHIDIECLMKSTSLNNTSSTISSCSDREVQWRVFYKSQCHQSVNIHIIMLVALLSFCSYANVLMTPSNTFNLLALNSNGFGSSHRQKIQNVNNLILTRQPHIFVLSETKTGSKICNDLPNTQYTICESIGVLRMGQKHGHKWGVAVGV